MNLAMSQFAWKQEEESQALAILAQHGFTGLEIAPTMAVGENPYDKQEEAVAFANRLKKDFSLGICSLQSIWYGKQGSLFGSEKEELFAYTKKAILFAECVGAKNLVFGSPKNRVRPAEASTQVAVDFFKEIGDFAWKHSTVLALEANPPVYGTNFMNTTEEAFEIMERADSAGCKINLDFGTILMNSESVSMLKNKVKHINHVHISEPELALIHNRNEHKELAHLLVEEGYTGFVSVEMKQQSLQEIEKTASYIAGVFA